MCMFVLNMFVHRYVVCAGIPSQRGDLTSAWHQSSITRGKAVVEVHYVIKAIIIVITLSLLTAALSAPPPPTPTPSLCFVLCS